MLAKLDSACEELRRCTSETSAVSKRRGTYTHPENKQQVGQDGSEERSLNDAKLALDKSDDCDDTEEC